MPLLSFKKLFSFSKSGFLTPETMKFFHHLRLRLLFIIVLAFFTIRAYPVGNSGSGYAVLSSKADNRASIPNVCTNTLMFFPLLAL